MSKIIGIYRHRLATDGKGVTTLVGFWGCPLRCRYCLNPVCFDKNANCLDLTPTQLYDRVKLDDLYFVSTGGGVTFGGGEPLLHSEFIREFRTLVGDRWRIRAETCLNVEEKNVLEVADALDELFVDVKDTNPEIYKAYTGLDNTRVLDNLRLLLSLKKEDAITVRLPLIKGYNSETDREKSEELLRSMGVTKFDKFEYRV